MPDDRPVVLLVDDEPTSLRTIAAALQTHYRIKVATNGPDALGLARQAPLPDLVLLDVMMPEMDGYAVCAALSGAPETARLPVIFLTAKTDAESETSALAAGAVDFIHKPINPDVVRARIRLQLALRRKTHQLQEANAELERHRDRLEDMVHARTLELAQARDVAEGASRAKSTFLRNVSHEMLTPLNHITGMSYLLQHDLPEGKARDRAEKVGQAAHHLLDLVKAVIDLSSLEASELRLEPGPFELRPMLEHLAEEHRPGALGKGLDLDVEFAPGSPLAVIGDAGRLSQVLGQLLDNAVKFSDQGRVRLRVEAEPAMRGRVELRFVVEDQGMGMAPETAAAVFEGFRQGDDGLTREQAGLGLGLTLCQRLASLMGGEILLDTAPGRGTTATLQVPLEVPTEAA